MGWTRLSLDWAEYITTQGEGALFTASQTLLLHGQVCMLHGAAPRHLLMPIRATRRFRLVMRSRVL